MASINISVPEPMRDWVQSRVESGRYATASDYLRELIRRDQDAADQRQVLVAALVEGEESGISPRRIPEILAAVRKERREAK